MYKGLTTPKVVPIYLFFIADKKILYWRHFINKEKISLKYIYIHIYKDKYLFFLYRYLNIRVSSFLLQHFLLCLDLLFFSFKNANVHLTIIFIYSSLTSESNVTFQTKSFHLYYWFKFKFYIGNHQDYLILTLNIVLKKKILFYNF